MKKLLMVLGAVLLAGCGPGKDLQTQDASAEIRPVMEKALARWVSLNAANAAPYYAKDAELTFYDVEPLKCKGWQEFADGFQKVVAEWKSMSGNIGPDFKAWRNGAIAWSTFTAPMHIETKTGESMNVEIRVTDIFERRGNDWIIVHEHASAPLPPPPPKTEAPKSQSKK